jgi:hypothetical protein
VAQAPRSFKSTTARVKVTKTTTHVKPDTTARVNVETAVIEPDSVAVKASIVKPVPALRKTSTVTGSTGSADNARRSPRRKSPVRITSGTSMRPINVQDGTSSAEVQLLTVQLSKYKEQVERLTQE